MPGVRRDLPEADGPVIAPAGEDGCRHISQVDLQPVTVELDLVYPALAGWHLLDGGGERRIDEAGVGCFHPDSRRLLALERHRSDQAHRQRQLDVAIAALVAVYEICRKNGMSRLQITAPTQFVCDVHGNVLRAAFGGVEGDDTDRVAVLAGEEVLDHRLQIGGLVVGFSPGPA